MKEANFSKEELRASLAEGIQLLKGKSSFSLKSFFLFFFLIFFIFLKYGTLLC